MNLKKPLFLFALCLAFAAPAFGGVAQFTGRVITVADGDTITVLTSDKRQVKIRLYGVDCPEYGQPFGARAKQATLDAAHRKKVTVQPMDTDNYGRTVAIVIMPGGRSLNEHLVREGMAWVYTRYCTQEEICGPLRKLEQAAKGQRRGLWADRAPLPPWEWRIGHQRF